MFELIEKLRNKSERTKKQIAFLVSFCLVGVIFVIWLSAIYPDLERDTEAQARISAIEQNPLTSFGNVISSGISSIGEKFNELKSAVSSFSADPAHYSATTTESVGTSTE